MAKNPDGTYTFTPDYHLEYAFDLADNSLPPQEIYYCLKDENGDLRDPDNRIIVTKDEVLAYSASLQAPTE